MAGTLGIRLSARTNGARTVVPDLRNRQPAAQRPADRHDKLCVTYGAAHLTGMLAILRRGPG